MVDPNEMDEDDEWEGLGPKAATVIQIPFHDIDSCGGGIEVHLGCKLTARQRSRRLNLIMRRVNREGAVEQAGYGGRG